MIRVQVTFDRDLSKAEQIILNLPNKLRDLKPFFTTQMAPAAERMLLRHWSSKGAAFGRKWAPWAPRTMADRLAKGNAGQGLLHDTGKMFANVFRNLRGARALTRTAKGIRVSLTGGLQRTVYHQVGTSFMPDRQVIPDPLPTVFMVELRRLFRAFLRD